MRYDIYWRFAEDDLVEQLKRQPTEQEVDEHRKLMDERGDFE